MSELPDLEIDLEDLEGLPPAEWVSEPTVKPARPLTVVPTHSATNAEILAEALLNEPQFLAPGAEPLTAEEIQAAYVKKPVWLSDFLAAAPKKPVPTIGLVEGDDRALCFANKTNVIAGESNQGKTTVAAIIIKELAEAGQNVLFADFEKDWDDFAVKALSIGVSPEDAKHIAYWRPQAPLVGQMMHQLLAFVRAYDIKLVVLDSWMRLMARHGWEYMDNTHNQLFYDHVLSQIEELTTVLVLDHLNKPQRLAGQKGVVRSQELMASGGHQKKGVVTGHLMVLRGVEPFSDRKSGHAEIVTGKSNAGSWTEGETCAHFKVDVKVIRSADPAANDSGEYETAFSIVRPDGPVLDANGEKVPTFLMERVSLFLEDSDVAVSQTAVVAGVKGKEEYVKKALARLVLEEFVSVSEGPRKSKMHTSAKAYRVSADPRASKIEPF